MAKSLTAKLLHKKNMQQKVRGKKKIMRKNLTVETPTDKKTAKSPKQKTCRSKEWRTKIT